MGLRLFKCCFPKLYTLTSDVTLRPTLNLATL